MADFWCKGMNFKITSQGDAAKKLQQTEKMENKHF